MEAETRKIMGRLNPNFKNFAQPVKSLSGGQRQAVAIARAVYFNARILIMDEPTAALGPAETAQVRNLVRQLKDEGIGIFLISHDIHDVFDLSDRISVMYHGRIVDTVDKGRVTPDDVLGMIILGKQPDEVTEKDKAAIELRGSSAQQPRRRRSAGGAELDPGLAEGRDPGHPDAAVLDAHGALGAVDGRRVLAVGRQRDRELEPDRGPRHPAGVASPTTAWGRPRSRGGGRDVAGGDRGADVGAADGPAVELERRDHDDLEPARPAELRERLRRPGALEAERGIGRHEEAGDRRALRDLAHERLVRRLAQPHGRSGR